MVICSKVDHTYICRENCIGWENLHWVRKIFAYCDWRGYRKLVYLQVCTQLPLLDRLVHHIGHLLCCSDELVKCTGNRLVVNTGIKCQMKDGGASSQLTCVGIPNTLYITSQCGIRTLCNYVSSSNL